MSRSLANLSAAVSCCSMGINWSGRYGNGLILWSMMFVAALFVANAIESYQKKNN